MNNTISQSQATDILFDLMRELATEIANNPNDWAEWMIIFSNSNSPLARQIYQWLLVQGTTVVPQDEP